MELESSEWEFDDIVCPICDYDGAHIANSYWKESLRCGKCAYLILPKNYPNKYIPIIKEIEL